MLSITANTMIYFTDFGWTVTGFMRNEYSTIGTCSAGQGGVTDGCILWTATSDMGTGTQVRIGAHYGLTASAGTVTSINRSSGSNGGPGGANVPQMSLSTSTDQIYAFKGVTTCGNTASQSSDPGANVGGFAFIYTASTLYFKQQPINRIKKRVCGNNTYKCAEHG